MIGGFSCATDATNMNIQQYEHYRKSVSFVYAVLRVT